MTGFLPSDQAGLTWPCCPLHEEGNSSVPRGVVSGMASDDDLIEALRAYNASAKAAAAALVALTDELNAAAEDNREAYEAFMYRLSHCDECDCLHGAPDPDCECVCHEPEPDG